MALYELFIPAQEENGFDVTTKVRGNSWVEALKHGLVKLEIKDVDVKSLMVDCTPEGQEVTEPETGRVFRLSEVDGDDGAETEPVKTPAKAKGKGKKVGRNKAETKRVEELLGELFEKTQDIYNCGSLEEASEFILNLALESVPAEAGAVFIADINAKPPDLYFSAAKGPKAGDVANFRVPMGEGVVGFSAQEGVAVAVSDVERDPRFYASISDKVGYEVRSLLCAPSQQDGRCFGAIELVNKNGNSSFTPNEVNVMCYLSHEFAQYLVDTGQTGD